MVTLFIFSVTVSEFGEQKNWIVVAAFLNRFDSYCYFSKEWLHSVTKSRYTLF